VSTFALRTADAGDAGAIAALHTANWRGAYAGILDPAYLAGPVEEDRRAVWHERLTAGPDDLEVVVAESEQGIVGFASLFHEREPGWGGFVDNLHSAASVRGQGVGKALLTEAARRVAARDRHIIGEDPDFLVLSGAELDHRAAAHLQQLMDRQRRLPEHDREFDKDIVD